jgi:hypothetical protein
MNRGVPFSGVDASAIEGRLSCAESSNVAGGNFHEIAPMLFSPTMRYGSREFCFAEQPAGDARSEIERMKKGAR